MLITGATGFVGGHLIKILVEDHEVFCLVRQREQLIAKIDKHDLEKCVLINGDLSQPLDIRSLPPKLDAIIHLACARDPFPEEATRFFRASTGSTQELLEYGRRAGITHFIYASSGSVYGFGPSPFRESDPPNLLDFYAVNKYCSELLVNAYKDYFYTCILRLFFPYGPSLVNRRIPMIAERVIQGRPVSLVNNGQPRINPIYIDDLVKIIEASLWLNRSVTVNVAGDEVINMKELAELIGELVGQCPVFENSVDPSISDLIGNNELMHKLFPLEKLTSLREGLKRMLVETLPKQGGF